MTTGEWSLAAVHDVLARAVPDREMLVCGGVRRTFAEVQQRSRGLAAFLRDRGVGLHRERAELQRWECGQDPVAVVLHNSTEYLEAMLGAFRARAVPVNVNQHYRATELGALLTDVGVRVAVYHRRYGPLLADAVDPADLVLIDVDDGSGVDALPGSTPYEEAVGTPVGELPETSPDDLYVVCTGGTTGRPKAVLWRQADIYVSAMAGVDGATEDSIAEAAVANVGGPWYPVPPLMHAAAQWTAFCGLHSGSTVLLHDDSGPFDAAAVLGRIDAERAQMISVVGDAHVRPLVEALRAGTFDLSSWQLMGTGGAATSEHLKEEVLDLVPHLTIMDGYGASETGGMAFGPMSRAGRAAAFIPAGGATVVSEDRVRFLAPGAEEVGWIARRGRVPLGYLDDREATEATFPIVDGERLSVPGDRGQLLEDGSIRLLGRDSMVVNTGGEKVFVEEVESVLLTHPDITDALVVGRPSDRFGQEVVAIVEPSGGADLDPGALREFVATEIARFKAPRAVLLVDAVHRHANGKADYRWAREIASEAVDATAR